MYDSRRQDGESRQAHFHNPMIQHRPHLQEEIPEAAQRRLRDERRTLLGNELGVACDELHGPVRDAGALLEG